MLAACEEVELAFGEILVEPGEAIRDVYFPTRSSISLLAPIGADHVLEVALTGNEGVYGLPGALGIRKSQVRALVQNAGGAWRISAAHFRGQLARSPKLRACVHAYAYVLMSQVINTAGCNRFHLVEQRVARWLLMTSDRCHSRTFLMTHSLLGYMLGVRRVGVTQAATALQHAGLIRYSRGDMTILDRKGLERASCSCYRSDLALYDDTFN